MVFTSVTIDFNSHAPWGAWQNLKKLYKNYWQFQLTRSVGSVTLYLQFDNILLNNFNSHAPWGAWRFWLSWWDKDKGISTHTLRGERDVHYVTSYFWYEKFQLTRSVGSVTVNPIIVKPGANISTHTLRGERDLIKNLENGKKVSISTHTLRGERDDIHNG